MGSARALVHIYMRAVTDRKCSNSNLIKSKQFFFKSSEEDACKNAFFGRHIDKRIATGEKHENDE